MRSFTSAVLVPLFFSSIISMLLVAALVSTDREVLEDVSQSIQAAISVFTQPERLFAVETPSRMVYPPLPAGEMVERSQVGPYRGDLPAHAPRYLSAGQSFDYYREMARLHGLSVQGPTVLGLRGLAPNGARHSSDENATPYDDTFVLLLPDSERAVELLGATHAGEASNPLSPQGIAQIEPGLYRATPSGPYLGMSSWYVTTRFGSGYLNCRRDVNGNGYIDEGEKRADFRASEILFHNGCGYYYGASRGCQVLPPGEMQRFIEMIGANTGFDYLRIDANVKL